MTPSAARVEANLALPSKTAPVGPTENWGGRRIPRSTNADALTPSGVASMLSDAENGDITRQAELFELMTERDTDLDTHLRTRRAAVERAGWEIQPADDSPAADRAAEFCREALDQVDVAGLISDCLDAVGKGFSCVQTHWLHESSRWLPERFEWWPQRWFELDDDGRTLMIAAETAGGDPVEMNPSDFIVHRVRARSGFDWQTPLLRACVRPWIIRHFSVKDWLAFAEVYGMPMRVGKLPPGVDFSSDEARNLWTMLQALGTDFAAMVRGEVEIEFVEAARGDGAIYDRLYEVGEKMLTKAILGQTLTSGGESGGSYALGQVHNQVRQDLAEADAEALDSTLSLQFLRPLTLFNLGAGAPPPRWNTLVERPKDMAAFGETLKTAQEIGVRIPLAWAHEELGIPVPEEGEAVLEAPLRQAQGGAAGLFEHGVQGGRIAPATALHGQGRDLLNQDAAAGGAEAEPTQGPPPEEGLAWFGEKRVVDEGAWEALSQAGKQRAAYVTGLDAERTAAAYRDLLDVMREGATLNAWLERLESAGISVPGAEEAGANQITRAHAALVHANAVAQTRQADNWRKAMATLEDRPIGQWLLGPEPCPICAPLDGRQAPLDGEFFSRIWPQLHHGCMCDVVTLRADQAEAAALDDSLPTFAPADEEVVWLFGRGDAFYREDAGEGPTTDEGRSDAELLARFPRVEPEEES